MQHWPRLSPSKLCCDTDYMSNTKQPELIIKHFHDQDYESCFHDMQSVTTERVAQKKANPDHITPNELWLVEHQDVYTLGLAGKQEHILMRTNTPVIQTDRGGQVTWHGKGQLVAYFLFDLDALGWSVRQLVTNAETIICDLLTPYLAPKKLTVKPQKSAPGVYVYDEAGVELGKIASLGFKIKNGFSYHGIAINIDCDLSVFQAINPCGYAGMTMLNLADLVDKVVSREQLEREFVSFVKKQL